MDTASTSPSAKASHGYQTDSRPFRDAPEERGRARGGPNASSAVDVSRALGITLPGECFERTPSLLLDEHRRNRTGVTPLAVPPGTSPGTPTAFASSSVHRAERRAQQTTRERRVPSRACHAARGETHAAESHRLAAWPSRAGPGLRNRARRLRGDTLPGPLMCSQTVLDRRDKFRVKIA